MFVNVGTVGQLDLLSKTRLFVHLVEWLFVHVTVLTTDADFSAVWLTRDQFGSTFLDQLGLIDIGDILKLSKGLSKICEIFESLRRLN